MNYEKRKAIKMPYTIIIAIVVVSIVVTIVVASYASTTSKQSEDADGGISRSETMVFPTLLGNENTFTLDFECYTSVGTMPLANQTFSAVERQNITDISTLYEKLKNTKSDSQISVELIEGRYIVFFTDIPDLRYAMISQSQDKRSVSFDYLPMQGGFFNQSIAGDSSGVQQIEDENFVTYVPYHLFEDDLLYLSGSNKNHELSHELGRYYKVRGKTEDFKSFYESLGEYKITEETNRLILEGTIYLRDGSWLSANIESVEGKIILNFKEENGQLYMAYNFYVK